jgi:hypothetical protein
MRVSPQLDLDIVINAEAANPVLLIQVGTFGGAWFAVLADDLVAAEVVGRALRAVACPADWDGINPWEQPIVQIGMERNLGIRGPEAIRVVLDGDSSNEAETFRSVVADAAALLDVSLEY